MAELTKAELAKMFLAQAALLTEQAKTLNTTTVPTSPPKLGHLVWGAAGGREVRLECATVVKTVAVVNGWYSLREPLLLMPPQWGDTPGGVNGTPMKLLLDGELKTTIPFQEGGLTRFDL